MAENQGGSCLPCKKKKCKCDRQLPTCGQCATSPQSCRYGENNKRGIPGGYLGTLELRLNETEVALYNALSELRGLKTEGTLIKCSNTAEPLIPRQMNGNKASKMAEWKQYPLSSSEDVENWWASFKSNQTTEDLTREQTETADIYENQRSDVQFPNTGILPSQPVETSLNVRMEEPPRTHFSDREPYGMPDYNALPRFQDDLQSQSPASSQHPNDQTLPTTEVSRMGIASYGAYIGVEDEMRRGSWNAMPNEERLNQNTVSEGEGSTLKKGSEGDGEMKRSKQLSAMFSHIYY